MLNPAYPADPQELLDLPPWFNFNPYTYVFGIEKCGSTNSMSDADCNKSPFSTKYTIVIVATMEQDTYGKVDKAASFDILVAVDCREDFFSFDSSDDVVVYKLRSVAEAQTFDSPVTQYAPGCGLQCRYELDVAYPPLADFDPETGSINILSDDKTLSGTTQNVKITCQSPISQVPGGIQTKNVKITFMDECWDAKLGTPTITPEY